MYKILIIDDEPRHRKGLANLISKLRPSYEVYQFKNGGEAFDFIKETNVDIIITDIRMPVMDGLEFIKCTKERQKNVKIIILSGYANFEYAQKAIELGAFDYILKPVDEDKINNLLIKVEKSIKDEQLNIKEKKLLMENLNNTLPVYVEWMLNKWINGTATESELSEVKSYITDSKEGMVIITETSRHHKSFNDYSIEEIGEISKNIKLWINEKLGSFGSTVSFYLRNFEDTLVSIVVKNREPLDRISFEGLKDIIGEIKKDYGIDIAIGMSNISGDILHEAQKCFNEARSSVYMSFYMGPGKVIRYSKSSCTEDLQPVVDQKSEGMLTNTIHNFSYERFIDILNDIISKMLVSGYPYPDKFKEAFKIVFINIIKQIGNALTEKQYNSIILMITNRIDSCEDMQDFKQISVDIIKQIVNIYGNLKNNKNDALIEKCLDYINNHYMEDLSLESISKKFSFNPSYFSTLFKEATGVNFIKYLLKIRIKNACELLQKTDKKIYEIALSVGYRDVKYFNRVFKAEKKMSPEVYRQLNNDFNL